MIDKEYIHALETAIEELLREKYFLDMTFRVAWEELANGCNCDFYIRLHFTDIFNTFETFSYTFIVKDLRSKYPELFIQIISFLDHFDNWYKDEGKDILNKFKYSGKNYFKKNIKIGKELEKSIFNFTRVKGRIT